MTKLRTNLALLGIVVLGFAVAQGPSLLFAARAKSFNALPTVGVYDAHDQAVYFSLIEQSRQQPRFLYVENRFTSYPTHALLLPFWATLGAAASFLELGTVQAYVLATLLSTSLLTYALYAFIRRKLGERGALTSVGFVVAAGGVGWIGGLVWAAFPGAGDRLQYLFPEWFWAHFSWTGEMSLSPHFAAVHILQLAAFGALLAKPRILTVAGAAAAAFVLGIIHPYSLALTAGVAAAVAGSKTIVDRGFRWAPAATATAAVVGSVAAAVYYTLEMSNDAGLASWYRQNVLQSPSPLGIIVSYLPLLPLVALGVRKLAGEWRKNRAAPLLLAWLLLPLLLAYVPSPFQRRFLDGYYLPVGLVAAYGWAAWRAGSRRKLVLGCALAFVLVLTPLLRAMNHAAALVENTYASDVSPDEVAALAWLRSRCQLGDVAVSDSLYLRQWIPFHTGSCSTAAGHQHLSALFKRDAALMHLAFGGSDPLLRAAAWRQLPERIRYVVLVDPVSHLPPCGIVATEFGKVRVVEVGSCPR